MDSYTLQSGLQAAVRWFHVFAAILWIGQTYLFNFFERHLMREEGNGEHVTGSLWMVHGGGFFRVEKHAFHEPMPRLLHWFKWEAAATWLSGAVLITLTYYMGGLLVEPEQSFAAATGAGVGALFLGWLLYDLLARSPLGKNEVLFALIGLALLVGLHYGLKEVMSARAALIHVGGVIGTIMAANVWMRILPAQRQMLAATRAGTTLSDALLATGPRRSKHNSYLVVPLVFIMISNHYPILTYGNAHSTVALVVIMLVGWVFARLLRG